MLFKDIPVGSRIDVRHIPLNNGDLNECITVEGIKIDEKRCVFYDKNVTFFFDIREYKNTSRTKRSSGDNYYAVSNLRQYINSFDENWFSPQTEYDAEPKFYEYRSRTENSYKGFLSFMSNKQLSVLRPMKYKCFVPNAHRKEVGKSVVELEDFVVVPSYSEIRDLSERDVDKRFLDEGKYNPVLADFCRKELEGWKAIFTRTHAGTSVRQAFVNVNDNLIEESYSCPCYRYGFAFMMSYVDDAPFYYEEDVGRYILDENSVVTASNEMTIDLFELLNI